MERKSRRFTTPVLQANGYESCDRFNYGIAEGIPPFLTLKIFAKRIVFETKEEAVEIHSESLSERDRVAGGGIPTSSGYPIKEVGISLLRVFIVKPLEERFQPLTLGFLVRGIQLNSCFIRTFSRFPLNHFSVPLHLRPLYRRTARGSQTSAPGEQCPFGRYPIPLPTMDAV